MMKFEYIPGDHVMEVSVPAVAAATATGYVALWEAPFNCYVQSVKLAASADITGQDTNTHHYNLDHVALSDETVTEKASLDLVNGTDLSAWDPHSLYAPTAPGFLVQSGDWLALECEKVGNGMATPSMLMKVTYRPSGLASS